MVNEVLGAGDSGDTPSRAAPWFGGAALKFSGTNKKDVRMRPASCLGGRGAIRRGPGEFSPKMFR